MLRAYVYKLDPTEIQKQQLAQTFGNVRFIYNRALNLKTTTYRESGRHLSAFDIMKELTSFKKEKERLQDTSTHAMQHAITHMEVAFKRFYKGAGFPKFKSKKAKKSFFIPIGLKLDYEENKVYIPKIKRVKMYKDREIEGEVRNATVIQKASGFYISILAETGKDKPLTGGIGDVGIDLGLKHFVITSDGEKVESPKYFVTAQNLLRRKQRHFSRQVKGSHRRIQTKQEIARLHEHIANQREDFLHKLSTSIAKRYDTVYTENLNVAGMVKNRKLSKAISDASRSTFITMLTYKCNNLVKIGRFEPSSKLCSSCGNVYGELKLSNRERTCGSCGVTHDRDINAAINIKDLGAGAQLAAANQTQ